MVLPNRLRLFGALFLGAASLLAGSAVARQTFNGASCLPEMWNGAFGSPPPELLAGAVGVYNADSVTASTLLVCPTPVTSIAGPNAAWEVTVTDTQTAGAILCQGTVSNADGTLAATTPNVSSGSAYTGTTALLLNTTAGGFSNLQTHTVRCQLAKLSFIRSASVP